MIQNHAAWAQQIGLPRHELGEGALNGFAIDGAASSRSQDSHIRAQIVQDAAPMPCAGYFLRKSLKNSSIWSHGSLRLSCFSLPCRGIPLGTSVQEIGLFYTMKQTFLPKHVGYEYNQKNPFCVQAPTKRSFSRRRGSIRAAVFSSIKQRVCFILHAFQEGVLRQIKALTTSLVFSTLADLTRDKAELVAENALLRHQLIILRRQMKRPVYRKTDRLLLVLLARMVRIWLEKAEALARDDSLDQRNGDKQSASSERNVSVENSSSWIFT